MGFDSCNNGCSNNNNNGNEWIWIIVAVIVILCLFGDNNILGGLFGNNDRDGRDCECDR